jgi:uncharacterized damage-inducible protein DinB
MHYPQLIAKHFRDVHFGGNWTSVNLKASLADVNWQQATTEVYGLNSIAKLVFHIHYYVAAVMKVLQGGPLDAHDKYSFDLPPIQSQEEWEIFLEKCWAAAEQFASLIEQLPEPQLGENFSEEKYGNYYRNLHGIIEHTHYHLGQIVVIKKILTQVEKN